MGVADEIEEALKFGQKVFVLPNQRCHKCGIELAAFEHGFCDSCRTLLRMPGSGKSPLCWKCTDAPANKEKNSGLCDACESRVRIGRGSSKAMFGNQIDQ